MQPDHDDTFDLPSDLQQQVDERRQPGLTAKDITAAMMSAESDVELPGKSRPASVTSCLLALKPGENYTKSFRVPSDTPLVDMETNLNKWREKLRESVSQSIRQARKKDTHKYSTESVHTMTPSGGIYLQVIVTRIE